jgi:SOS-response transcriptional repressor LexA
MFDKGFQKIILEPENNDYEPIILDNADEAKAEEFVAVGEFVGVLTGE